ncbi:glycosyltransferase [Nonlabens sp.]|uniref:glycosyltransferase n=1 Tax=Nonlabens sp. TaxID=1888209 RepID=UPI003262E340
MTRKIFLYVPTLVGGGAEKVFVLLSKYFLTQGYDVTILCAYGNVYQEIIPSKVKVMRLCKKSPFKNKKLNLLFRLLCMPFLLLKVLVIHKPNFFMATVHEANLLSYFCYKIFGSKKTKLIIRLANIFEPATIGKLSAPLKYVISNSKYLIANSPDTAHSYIQFVGKKIDINIIGNPAYNNSKKEEEVISDNYLIAVGRLEPQKNYILMLEAFHLVIKKYPDLKLFILGTGSLESEIISNIKSLNLVENVELKGFVKNPSFYYKNAKAFILSSDFEGFGNVIIEAMSHGLPVISAKCPGGPNFILNRSEFGELCEVKNPKAMATAILRVLNNPEKYPKEAIIKRAKDFSLEKIGEEYLRVITDS